MMEPPCRVHGPSLTLSGLLLAAVLAASCARYRGARAGDCARGEPNLPAMLDSARLAQLPGRYDLTVVTTAKGHPRTTRQGTLHLAPNDTTSRYYQQFITRRVRRGDRALAGTVLFQGEQHRDTITVDQRGMKVGDCQFAYCTDGPVSPYRITREDSWGYGGEWLTDQWATSFVPVSKTGEFLPNPSGHFCMRRAVSDQR
jgi:hypothetical protein